MSAPLPPTFPPPEPPHACHNCGEWLQPGEPWFCAECAARWGYDDYETRVLARAKPALANERNADWWAWKYRKDTGAFREPRAKDDPGLMAYPDGSVVEDTPENRRAAVYHYEKPPRLPSVKGL